MAFKKARKSQKEAKTRKKQKEQEEEKERKNIRTAQTTLKPCLKKHKKIAKKKKKYIKIEDSTITLLPKSSLRGTRLVRSGQNWESPPCEAATSTPPAKLGKVLSRGYQ